MHQEIKISFSSRAKKMEKSIEIFRIGRLALLRRRMFPHADNNMNTNYNKYEMSSWKINVYCDIQSLERLQMDKMSLFIGMTVFVGLNAKGPSPQMRQQFYSIFVFFFCSDNLFGAKMKFNDLRINIHLPIQQNRMFSRFFSPKWDIDYIYLYIYKCLRTAPNNNNNDKNIESFGFREKI